MKSSPVRSRKQLIWLAITVSIILAVLVGRFKSQESQLQTIQKYFPGTVYQVNPINDHKWSLVEKGKAKKTLIYLGKGTGYNGGVTVLTLLNNDSSIKLVLPIKHQETPSYYKKMINNNFLKRFRGEKLNQIDPFRGIDVVSGATFTSNAIKEGVIKGYANAENLALEEKKQPVMGILEFIIIYLLITGFLLSKIKVQKYRNSLLWSSLFISLISIGFIYNQPLSYSRISAFLLGNFPDSTKELYFYFMLFGSGLLILFTGKNIYCHSVCPFGAAQEVFSKIGKSKPYRPDIYKKLKIIQRSLAFSALILALVLNNPSIAGYEIFSAFFHLTANTILIVVLFIVILLSLIIKRPWCNFMCPMDSAFEYLRLTRKLITSLWKKENNSSDLLS